MHPVEVRRALEAMVVLVDTREQDTPRLRARLRQMQRPYERVKLEFGDYSARFGDVLDLSRFVAIERKMSLDELAACYTRERRRFEAEFQRARDNGAKLYLLVESATWEKAYAGDYRCKVSAEALTASMLAWLARYDCQLLMCSPAQSGRLIRDILYREGKERLEAMGDG